MGLQVTPVVEDLAGQGVALDVLDPGLDLALALGVVALAGMDAEPGGSGVGGKGLVQFQLPILLVQYHQAGLVVDTLLGTTAEIAEGGIVQADEGGGVDGPGREPGVHQPRVREDEDHKVHRGRLAADRQTPQFATIDLALHSRQALDRLVVTLLAQADGLLERLDVASRRAVRDAQLRVALLELAQHLHRAEVGELTQQGDDVVPIVIQLFVPRPVRLLLADGDLVHAQILADSIAGDAQLAGNRPDAQSGSLVV